MIEIRQNGVTRLVFLTSRCAIKIPRVRYGWAMFLRGRVVLLDYGELT